MADPDDSEPEEEPLARTTSIELSHKVPAKREQSEESVSILSSDVRKIISTGILYSSKWSLALQHAVASCTAGVAVISLPHPPTAQIKHLERMNRFFDTAGVNRQLTWHRDQAHPLTTARRTRHLRTRVVLCGTPAGIRCVLSRPKCTPNQNTK